MVMIGPFDVSRISLALADLSVGNRKEIIILAPRCFLWVALNPEVGPELSQNFQDTTIWDKTNANRRIGLNHCEAVSKELRIDILRLPTRNSEEPYFLY